MQQHKKHITILFLIVQCILYYFILTAGGNLFKATAYPAIILCFLFALLMNGKHNFFFVGGLACTVGADFCLVICDPIQRLWGMVFFLGAQTLYAIGLHKRHKSNILLTIRIALIAIIEGIAALILKDKLDALAAVSVCYYANLFMNFVAALTQQRKSKMLPLAFLLFIFCDTIIGLQVASGAYLPITEGSALYKFLFMDFNLSWFFYLPSQVLISLSTIWRKKNG